MRMYIFTTTEGTISDTRGANQKSPKLECRRKQLIVQLCAAKYRELYPL